MRGVATSLFVLCVAARGFAQPADPPAAPPAAPPGDAAPAATEPDFARATELYNAATRAMTEGRHDDAARDFLAAFAITNDPVLFFKIGGAYEKAGKCTEAITYFERYLNEANPADNFVALTRERIDACKLQQLQPAPAAEPSAPAEAAARTQPSKNKDRAWLFVGGALTFVTAGAVLAYATASAEQDIKDLYVSDDGRPPVFNTETQERYDALNDEGRRYEVLAWTSFGIAAGCALGATIFFLRDDGDVTVTPIVTPKETGVSATLRF